MKQFKNQQGYALLVVLLMVVLFLGVSATFMAGSLSNAKQEQTVDASNQAVASAEMGVKYHSAEFQREVLIIKNKILIMTQNRIKGIMDCFNSGNTTCDEQAELTAMEQSIDVDMKSEYMDLIKEKVTKLKALKTFKNTPFPGEDAHYTITDASVMELNSGKEDVTLSATSDKVIKFLQVKMDLKGESKGSTKILKGLFTVEVPDTFLSSDKSLTLETLDSEGNVSLDLIFKESPTTKSCSSLMSELTNDKTSTGTVCVMDSEQTVEEFVNYLISINLNPKNFTIYVENFNESYCKAEGTSGNSCNQKELAGITVRVSSTDEIITDNKKKGFTWNGVSNSNTIFDGLLTIGALNNTSIHADEEVKISQTIIARELHVTSPISSEGGLQNTNLVILGKDTADNLVDSRMIFDNHVNIGDYGRICFNMDRVLEQDWKNLRDKVRFLEMNGTGQIIYYTSSPLPSGKKFILPSDKNADNKPDDNLLPSKERTKLYVQEYNEFSEFLSSCGVKLSGTITEVPLPFILDPGFDLDVEY